MGIGIFTLQSVGEIDDPMACLQITRVQVFDALEMLLSRSFDGLQQHGDAIFLALAIPHHDLIVGKVLVFDAQTQTLQQAELLDCLCP